MNNPENTKMVNTKDHQSIYVDIDTIKIIDFDNNRKIIKYQAFMANGTKSYIPVDYQEAGIIEDIDTKLTVRDNPIEQYYQAHKQEPDTYADNHDDEYLRTLLSNIVNDYPEKFFTKKGNWKSNLINYDFYNLDRIIRNYVLQTEILKLFKQRPTKILNMQALQRLLSYNRINNYINHATEDSYIARNLSRLVINQQIIKIDTNQYILASNNNDKLKLQIQIAKVIKLANELDVSDTLAILKQAQTTLQTKKNADL